MKEKLNDNWYKREPRIESEETNGKGKKMKVLKRSSKATNNKEKGNGNDKTKPSK